MGPSSEAPVARPDRMRKIQLFRSTWARLPWELVLEHRCPPALEEARDNRRLLYNLMVSVGFVNYQCEWWHYAYGESFLEEAGPELRIDGLLDAEGPESVKHKDGIALGQLVCRQGHRALLRAVLESLGSKPPACTLTVAFQTGQPLPPIGGVIQELPREGGRVGQGLPAVYRRRYPAPGKTTVTVWPTREIPWWEPMNWT